MLLQGSCHCGAVMFTVQSHTPYPFMHCYCSICRKTQGGGGFSINIMGLYKSLKVTGKKHRKFFRASLDDPDRPGKKVLSSMKRYFCGRCGSALYGWDRQWAQWVYPFASAIDTRLPKAPQRIHIMLNDAAPWVPVPKGKNDQHYPEYPKESILGWHKKMKLYVK